MSFADQMQRIVGKHIARLESVPAGVDAEVFRSIVDGSEVTGAPGQPVRSGRLKASWQQERTGDESVAASDSPYARAVEENVGDVHYENGGPHSVELTVVGFPRIVQEVVGE